MAVTNQHSAAGARLDGVERIAILRAGGLGDTIFLLPALDALRTAYPTAEFTLLGGGIQASLFQARPPIDRVIELPPIAGVTAPHDPDVDEAAVDFAIERIAAEHFDVAIQAHGGGRYSNALTRRLGAAFTLGCRTPDAAPLDVTMPHIYHASEVERWLELVSLIGASAQSHEPRLSLLPGDFSEAASIVEAVAGDGPLVAMHVGAGDPRRRWPPACFAEVAAALVAEGCRVVIVGASADRPVVNATLAALPPAGWSHVTDVCESLSLGGLAALLAQCEVLVGNDSGPLHLAAAVGARTVGIYWCTNLTNAGPPGRRYHRPQVAWRADCPVCGVNLAESECDHDQSLVASVPVAAVVEATLDLLREAEAEAPAAATPKLASRRQEATD